MRAIETIMDVKENGEFVLHFPREVKPGRYKVVVVVEDDLIGEEYELSPEIEKAYKAEIDRRLDEMKRNPHPGFTMKEVAQELTVELGRKIQTRTIS
ncbi:MAG: addiction module protein [Leptospiraceae bacterium]|nr:hypothetical protein [Leptospiraceae bacterium]MCK6381053.1 addiction module protein [Leptospiraceae bacterium]NUM40608.1 hypothetical protein [Leptospiraceae bacterium]